MITASGAPDSDVWAIGDAAVMQDQRLPATAQGQLFRATAASEELDLYREHSRKSKGQVPCQEAEQNRERPRLSQAI